MQHILVLKTGMGFIDPALLNRIHGGTCNEAMCHDAPALRMDT
jgi:hypothetical protein